MEELMGLVPALWAFAMEHWIVVVIVALVVIRILKKAMRLSRRALYLLYATQGGLAGFGVITDIIEKLMDK